MKRSEFVEFDGRKSNKCFEISRYLLQGLSGLNFTKSSHSICRPFQRLFCRQRMRVSFLIIYIHLLGEKTANVNLCLFSRWRQHYKVHTYFISMEFSAVNRRRPSHETPLGPGAKKDGCFHRLVFDKRLGFNSFPENSTIASSEVNTILFITVSAFHGQT